MNQFCGASLGTASYVGSDGYVVQKSSVLGGGPIHVTAFQSLSDAYTPQGVDNADPAATEGLPPRWIASASGTGSTCAGSATRSGLAHARGRHDHDRDPGRTRSPSRTSATPAAATGSWTRAITGRWPRTTATAAVDRPWTWVTSGSCRVWPAGTADPRRRLLVGADRASPRARRPRSARPAGVRRGRPPTPPSTATARSWSTGRATRPSGTPSPAPPISQRRAVRAAGRRHAEHAASRIETYRHGAGAYNPSFDSGRDQRFPALGRLLVHQPRSVRRHDPVDDPGVRASREPVRRACRAADWPRRRPLRRRPARPGRRRPGERQRRRHRDARAAARASTTRRPACRPRPAGCASRPR